jgi:hypothetical protein
MDLLNVIIKRVAFMIMVKKLLKKFVDVDIIVMDKVIALYHLLQELKNGIKEFNF